jgi:hypothetical protein
LYFILGDRVLKLKNMKKSDTFFKDQIKIQKHYLPGKINGKAGEKSEVVSVPFPTTLPYINVGLNCILTGKNVFDLKMHFAISKIFFFWLPLSKIFIKT